MKRIDTTPRFSPRLASGGLTGLLLSFGMSAHAQFCAPPTPSISSPTAPVDVNLTCTNANPITDFDDFSWRSFVALIWPAAKGQRGIPDPTQTNFPVTSPLVFETYKADWESFPLPGAPNPPPAPLPWSSFAGTSNPCGPAANIGWGDLALASNTKFGNLGLAGFGNFFVGPVISSGFSPHASQQHYLRYQASYNQTEFDQILGNKWYLQANLGNLTFCSNGATIGGSACPAENSIDLKSSWMDMDGVPANLQSRYYTKNAWVLDPTSGSCSTRTMGLVGLHIVTKTPSRPQWIWSSFEQIDNVPPVTGATPTGNTVFNLNDGKGAAMPSQNPYCVPGQPGNQNGCPGNPPPPAAMPSDASQATRFNVTRTQPIGIGAGSTPSTNAAYQALLAKAAPNSPWQYYQLVMTQWPVPGNAPKNPGSPKFTFPGSNPTSSFSNVTMETFDQSSIFSGCMNCHNATAHPNGGSTPGNDFLWSLAINAYAAPSALEAALAKPRLHPSSLAALKTLSALQSGAIAKNKALLKAAKKASPAAGQP